MDTIVETLTRRAVERETDALMQEMNAWVAYRRGEISEREYIMTLQRGLLVSELSLQSRLDPLPQPHWTARVLKRIPVLRRLTGEGRRDGD